MANGGNHGGKRAGSGRKPGSRNLAQKQAIDVAAAVLNSIDAEAKWLELLRSDDPKVVFDVMRYLTDRVCGRPSQTIAGDKDKPLSITQQTFPVDW
jgi:hypothetical protein